jgi:hypothetical protein
MEVIAPPSPIKRSRSAPAGATRIKTKEEKARNVLKKAIENGSINELLWDGTKAVDRSNEQKPELSNERKDDTFMNDVKLFNSVLMARVMHSKSLLLEEEYEKMKKLASEVEKTSNTLQDGSENQKQQSQQPENPEDDNEEIDEAEEKKEVQRLNEALVKFQKHPSTFLSPSSPNSAKKNLLISPRKKKVAVLPSKGSTKQSASSPTKERLVSPGRKPPSKPSPLTQPVTETEPRKSSKTDFNALPGLIPGSSKDQFYFGTSLKKPRRVFDIIKSARSTVEYLKRYLPNHMNNNRIEEEVNEEDEKDVESEEKHESHEMDNDNPFAFLDNPEVCALLLCCSPDLPNFFLCLSFLLSNAFSIFCFFWCSLLPFLSSHMSALSLFLMLV